MKFNKWMLVCLLFTVQANALEIYLKDENITDNANSKPRIYIKNTGTSTLNGFYFYYYFTTENGKTPVLESYYLPNSTVSLENRNSGVYRIKYNCTGVNLAPGAVYPDMGGCSVGLHYSDYTTWVKTNDYSYNGSSVFAATSKIPVYNTSGSLLAGIDPESSIPPAPVLSLPADAAINIPINPTIQWNPADRAESYSLQISTASDFSSLILNQAGITTTNFNISGLINNAVYYWRINAVNSNGTSPWSEVRHFTTVIAAPSAPVQVSPINNAVNVPVSTVINWNPSVTVIFYSLQISTNPGFTSYIVNQSGLTGTTYNLSGLFNNNIYYWRVNATNTGGTSAWSTVWSFTTIPSPPTVPLLTSPVNGAVDIPVNTSLLWNAATEASSYTIQVSTSSTFTSLLYNQSGVATTTFNLTGLSNNTQYWWRISSENSGGTSGWSESRSFTTNNIPSEPPEIPLSQWDYSVISRDSTILKDRFHLSGNGYIGSKHYIEIGLDAVLSTDLLSEDNILVKERAHINGNLIAAGNITLQNQAVVAGTINQHLASVSIPDISSKGSIAYGTKDTTIGIGEIKELDPADYRDLHVFSTAKLTFKAGTYFFRNLIIEPDCDLHFDAGQGVKIKINVQNGIHFSDRTKFFIPDNYFPSDIEIYSNCTDSVTIGKNCIINGSVCAPSALICIYSGTNFNGAVYGRTVRFEPDASIDGDPVSPLIDSDNDGVYNLVEKIFGTDSTDSQNRPYFGVPDIYILQDGASHVVDYDFSKYYEDYSSCKDAPVTESGDATNNGIVPMVAVWNSPVDTGVKEPAIDTLKMVGRYIEYYGNIKAGKSITVFVPFPDGVVIIPELVMIGHYVTDHWDVIEPDSVNQFGAYCTVTSLSPFVIFTKKLKSEAYAEGGSLYTREITDPDAKIGYLFALKMNKTTDDGKITIIYENASGVTKTLGTTFSRYIENYRFSSLEPAASSYYASADFVEPGPVVIKKIEIEIPGTAGKYTENCSYTLMPGDLGQLTLFKTPEELTNSEAKGDKITFSHFISALFRRYTLISGADGTEGRIVPIYNRGGVAYYNYDYYLKDHLGSTREMINDQDIITEAVNYSPYGMMESLASVGTEKAKEKFTGKEYDEEGPLGGGTGINAYYFGARYYDPELGIWMSPDVAQQFWNSYGYSANPVIMIDEDGNFAWIIPALLIAAGGAMNVASNRDNIDNFWEGLGYFAIGAGQSAAAMYGGPVGAIIGGGLGGMANAAIGGASGDQILMSGFIGAFSSGVGYGVGQWAANNIGSVVINGFSIGSPVLKGAVAGAVGGAAGGYAGGFIGGLIISGGNISTANKTGLGSLGTGAVTGGVAGGMGGYAAAKSSDINPWSGRANNSIVIGENQVGRVEPAARDLHSSTIRNDWPADNFYGDRLAGKQFNANWIDTRMEQNYWIYDIGPKGSTTTSPYYGLESAHTLNYPNVSNVIHIQVNEGIRVYFIY